MIRWDHLAVWGGMTLWAAGVCLAVIWWSIPTPPVPSVATGAYCLPRPGLAELTHLCREENVMVDL